MPLIADAVIAGVDIPLVVFVFVVVVVVVASAVAAAAAVIVVVTILQQIKPTNTQYITLSKVNTSSA